MGVASRTTGNRLRRRAAVATWVVGSLVGALLVTVPAPAHADPHLGAERRFYELINADRVAHDLPPLATRRDLRDVAYAWSTRMAEEQRLAHNPDYHEQITCWARISQNVVFTSGYDWETSVDIMHAGLMRSDSHRAHILDTRVSEVGVGVHWDGTTMWVTQNFRRPTECAPREPAPGPDGTPLDPPDPRLPHACPVGTYTTGHFGDIDPWRGHGPTVDCLAAWGIVAGHADGSYRPGRPITRAQAATMVRRLITESGAWLPDEVAVELADLEGHVHARASSSLVAVGILRGSTSSTFDPDGVLTRGQMATIVATTYEYIADRQLPEGEVAFEDVAGTAHARAIGRAAAAGIARGQTATSFAPNEPATRGQVASLLARLLDRLIEDGAVERDEGDGSEGEGPRPNALTSAPASRGA